MVANIGNCFELRWGFFDGMILGGVLEGLFWGFPFLVVYFLLGKLNLL